jgi:hypothetical protein
MKARPEYTIASGATKNQMKLTCGQSLYHKEPPFFDMLDDLLGIQQLKIISDSFCLPHFLSKLIVGSCASSASCSSSTL